MELLSLFSLSYRKVIFLGLVVLLFGFASLVGCGKPKQSTPDVFVAAASDLIHVSQPLGEAFQKATGKRVEFGFGASGQLEQQARKGAPYDVFVPASRTYTSGLVRDGFTDGDEKPFARGRLVVWSKSLKIGSLNELTGIEVTRIAMANPKFAPYGLAAMQALQAAGMWDRLEPKIVYGESVSHALQMAETGNADIAFVALSLVHDQPHFDVDPKLYQPIEQAGVVLKTSEHKPAAHAFVDFLASAEAQKILEVYGFGKP